MMSSFARKPSQPVKLRMTAAPYNLPKPRRKRKPLRTRVSKTKPLRQYDTSVTEPPYAASEEVTYDTENPKNEDEINQGDTQANDDVNEEIKAENDHNRDAAHEYQLSQIELKSTIAVLAPNKTFWLAKVVGRRRPDTLLVRWYGEIQDLPHHYALLDWHDKITLDSVLKINVNVRLFRQQGLWVLQDNVKSITKKLQ